MVNKTIKYIGFYNLPENKNRVLNLAAVNKMDYISDSIIKNKYRIEFISAAWLCKRNKINYEAQRSIKISKNKKLVLGPSFKLNNPLVDNIGKLYTLLWMFFYLLINVKRNETILVYHSPKIILLVSLVKLIKRNKIILEVEEIYGEVWKTNRLSYFFERRLIRMANSYIFVSEVLKEKIKTEKKSIILYGSYLQINESLLGRVRENEKENRVKIVYAGAIEETRGGAFKSIEISRYIPENYEVNILGYGDEKQIDNLKRKIKSINHSLKREAVKYRGVLHDKEYSEFLLNCHIAINPQHMGNYMDSAFPSKIISYLSHSLIVVSTKLKGIEKSSISNHIYQVNSDEPIEFAKKIMGIKLTNQKVNKDIIDQLDNNFIKEINLLLKS